MRDHYYGGILEQELEQTIESGAPSFEESNSDQLHYAMVDGSMLLTREEKWKEIKLGRIFAAADNVEVSQGHGVITASSRMCGTHLGGHEEFAEKFDHLVSCLLNVVFIADSAKWFWNWVETFHLNTIHPARAGFFMPKNPACAGSIRPALF